MTARLQVQFLGLNEGDDPKNLPPGTMLRSENYRMDKARRLIKRWGTTGLAKTALSGSNPSSGQRLITNGKSLAFTDGETVWSYAESLSKWNPIDRISPWGVTKRPLVDTTRSVSGLDIAIYGDMIVTLYASGGIFCRVDSLSSGENLYAPTAVVATTSTDRCPRVLISDTSAYLLYATGSAVGIAKLDLATFTLTSGTTLVNDATASATLFDAVIGTPTAGVPTLYLAYELATGVNRTRVKSFTVSTLAAITSVDSLGTSLYSINIAFGALSQRVGLIYASFTSNSTKITSFTTALASQIGPTQVEASDADFSFIDEFDSTDWLVGWTRNSTSGDGADADRLRTSKYSIAAHTLDTTSRRTTFGVYSATKPWKTGNRWFVGAMSYAHSDAFPSDQNIAQPSTIVLEIETADSLTGVSDSTHPHVATLQNYTGWFATGGGQTKPAVDASGNVWLASPFRDREPQGYTRTIVIPTGWDLFTLTTSGSDTFRSAQIGPSSMLACGAPAWFDGVSAQPFGFVHTPVIIGAPASAGGAVVAGDYSYVRTYAWRDANGVLHRSAASDPLVGTTTGANLTLSPYGSTSSISSKVRTLTSSTSPNPVYVEHWRTTIGGTGDHYQLSLEPTFQPVVNNAQVNTVALTDTKADSNIATTGTLPNVALNAQARLYTDLGELENIPPPAFITCVAHQGRIAGIGPDLRTVWLSKDSRIDATIAPGFNEALTLAFPRDKTALASLDTTLVAFGKDTIDLITGAGPDDTGSGNTWEVQPVQSDVGCINPRSVVTSPMGVVFESRRGLDLLDRSLNVTSILGRNVADTVSAYPNITSGVLVAEENEIRFTCDNGTNGIVLAYDYLNKAWFTRKYTDASDTGAASIRFVDAALIDGVYTLLTAGGQVYRETDDSYLDGGSAYVETDVLLSPISAQPGRSGWSNDNLAWTRMKDVTLMGTSLALHDLEVSFAQDYATTFSQTHTFAANATGTPTTPGPLEKARVTIATQKCQAVQIRIRDLTPTGSSPADDSGGPILESLLIRVGAKEGPAKTSSGQQG